MDESSRKKILEMLSDGKITVDEASALLSKITTDLPAVEDINPAESGEQSGKPPRYLRVLVNSAGGDKVNVRVPLSLIKTGIKLKALIPGNAMDEMNAHGFDLSQLSALDGDELIAALRDLQVDVDSADGDKVRVFTE